jgi:N-acetylneuraminic acid mutarotase
MFYVDILNRAEVYDPVTGNWTMTGSMNSPRFWHTASVLRNGKVLITGGVEDGVTAIHTTELYDPLTRNWTRAHNMHVARVFHTATLLKNGKVLVAGGSSSDSLDSCELYDPVENRWTVTGSLQSISYRWISFLWQYQ